MADGGAGSGAFGQLMRELAARGVPEACRWVARDRRERDVLAANRRTLRYHVGITGSERMLAHFPRVVWPRPWSPQDYGDYRSEPQDSLGGWIDCESMPDTV